MALTFLPTVQVLPVQWLPLFELLFLQPESNIPQLSNMAKKGNIFFMSVILV